MSAGYLTGHSGSTYRMANLQSVAMANLQSVSIM